MLEYAVDDAWIHQVYAKNIYICKKAFVYNNCGDFQSGETSPLWSFILLLGYILKTDPVLTSKIFSILFAFLSMFLIYLLFKKHPKLCFVSLLLLSINVYWVWGAIGGMEQTLFTCLMLISVYFFVKKKKILSFIFLGLTILTRPEGLGLYFLLIGFDVYVNYKLKKKSLFSTFKHSLPYYLITLIVVCPWFLYNFSLYSKPFPATFYAKQEPLEIVKLTAPLKIIRFGANLISISSAFNFLDFFIRIKTPLFKHLFFNVCLFMISLCIFGLIVYYIWQNVKRIRTIEILILFFYLCIFLTGISYSVSIGLWGPKYDYRRFIIPIIPAYIVNLSTVLYSKRAKKLFFLFLIVSILSLPLGLDYLNTQTKNMRNFVNYWKFLNKNLPAKAIIGITNAGVPRYFLNKSIKVYDLIGLNNYEVVGKDRLKYIINKNITFLESLWFTSYIKPDKKSFIEVFRRGNKHIYEFNKTKLSQDWLEEYYEKFVNASFLIKLLKWSKKAG